MVAVCENRRNLCVFFLLGSFQDVFQTGLKETAMAKQVELTHFETQSCNYIARSFEIMPVIFFVTWLIVISWVRPPVVISWIYPPSQQQW